MKVRIGDVTDMVEAAVPRASLGLRPEKDMVLLADLGFISSDPNGSINVVRTYWSNKDTNLVNDLPQEAWFRPAKLGTLIFR